MNNFEYYNPVKILFGNDKIEQLKKEIGDNKKILLTYGGGSIKKNGTYERVINALSGCNIVEFGGIEANPKYETLLKAIELGRKNNIDFILAVGGGSVIDGSKFIAAAIPFKENPWKIISEQKSIEKAITLGTILTLPATGSEMNSGAVISRLETKEKFAFGSPLLFPKFSILDPTLTFSLPQRQVSNGIVDAFAHVLEQYLTYPTNSPIQDRFAESILKTLIEVGPLTLENPENYEHRANFMWSCTMALNGLIATGVPTDWATHMIGHELTALFGLDHGVTLAIVFPALMRVLIEEKKGKLLQLGKNVWHIADNEITPELVIDKIELFFRSLGVKTRLPEYSISFDDVQPIVIRFKQRNWSIGENKSVNYEVVEKILKKASETL